MTACYGAWLDAGGLSHESNYLLWARISLGISRYTQWPTAVHMKATVSHTGNQDEKQTGIYTLSSNASYINYRVWRPGNVLLGPAFCLIAFDAEVLA